METQTDLVKCSRYGVGVRHIMVMLMFFLLTIGVGMRYHLALAIVAMTDNSTSSNPDIPTYDWDNKSVILSSFFWLYSCFQITTGEFSRRFGTKRILIVGMFCNSTICALVPLLAEHVGSYGVMACRILQGVSQGFYYPSVYAVLGRWTPTNERSRMATFALTGGAFGIVITQPTVGYICSSSIGWPATFYLYGIVGYVWVIFWYFFGANYPAEHKMISKEERNYIESSINSEPIKPKSKIPWKAILTSLPAWSISVQYLGQNWGYAIIGNEMPTYLDKVLNYDIKSDGVLSAVPYMTGVPLSFVCGWLADFIINRKYWSRITTRKIFTTIANTVPTITMTVLCYLPNNHPNLSVLMFILPMTAEAALYGGSYVSHIDLSPNYAETIMAFSNFLPNFCAILSPLFVQLIITDETDRSQWKIIFLTAAVMFLVTNIFYIIFASGEVQPWNNPNNGEESDREESDTNKLEPNCYNAVAVVEKV